jgi:hypothetical protein
MIDQVLKWLAMLCFIASLGVLAVRVPHPSLVAVLLVVVATIVYDFIVRPYLRGNSRRT